MVDVLMPKLGESVTEGTLGQWLKQVGDPVQKYDSLVEVVTDKVTAEIPSDVDGVLSEILVEQNHTVVVGTVIARITTVDKIPDSIVSVSASSIVVDRQETALKPQKNTKRFSPAVRQLAAMHHIDPLSVPGTGLGGRVTRKDILLAVSTPLVDQSVQKRPATVLQPQAPLSHTFHDQQANDQLLTITPIRRTIATRMTDSSRDIPHAWMMVEVDVTNMVKLREMNKCSFKEKEGIDLTFFPFFMKAVVEALKAFPMVNSSWTDDHIILHKEVNLSVAVATEDALVVPVIHQADRLSVFGLAAAVTNLAARARQNKLTIADVQGGTFTLNNTGAFGSIQSMPIINTPQAAIVSVESIVRRPVVVNSDCLAIRSMVNLCISIDHRVLDGLVTGRFMRYIKDKLEAMDDSTSLY